MSICPRCRAGVLHDADGDVFCLPCGWRLIPGSQLAPATARKERAKGRRLPTHGGRQL